MPTSRPITLNVFHFRQEVLFFLILTANVVFFLQGTEGAQVSVRFVSCYTFQRAQDSSSSDWRPLSYYYRTLQNQRIKHKISVTIYAI